MTDPAILEALIFMTHEIIDRVYDEDGTHRDMADEIAAAVLELVGPKPLVWDVFECGRGAKATAWRKANYLITRWSDGRFELVESYPGYQGDNIAGAFMPTLEAAQAAAQAHADAAHWANTKIGGE